MHLARKSLGQAWIHVLDDIFDPDVQHLAYRTLAGLQYFRQQGDAPGDDYLSLAAFIAPEDLLEEGAFGFAQVLDHHVRAQIPERHLALERAYVNQLYYGDQSSPHVDCDAGQGHVTALYFAHREWQPEWGGATLFLGGDGPFDISVAPRPGRLVIFPGDLLHSAGVPHRICRFARFSLTLKYKPTSTNSSHAS